MPLYTWKDPNNPSSTRKLLYRAGPFEGGVSGLAIDERCCCEDSGVLPCYVCHPCISVYIDVGAKGEWLGTLSYDYFASCYNLVLQNARPLIDGVSTIDLITPTIIWVRDWMYFNLEIYINNSVRLYSTWIPVSVADTPPDDKCADLLLFAEQANMNLQAAGGGGSTLTARMAIQTNTGFCDTSISMGGGSKLYFDIAGLTSPTIGCGVPEEVQVTRDEAPDDWTATDVLLGWTITLTAQSLPRCGYEVTVQCAIQWIKYRKSTCGGPAGTYAFHSASTGVVGTPGSIEVT